MQPTEPVRIAVLTDLHLAEAGTPDGHWLGILPLGRSVELLREAIAVVLELRPDAVALLGDLTQDGTDAQLGMLASVLADMPIPVWAVPGNHDLGRGPTPLDRLAGTVQLPGPGSSVGRLPLAAGTLVRSADGSAYLEGVLPDPAGWPAEPVLWLTHFPAIGLRDPVTAAGLPYAGDLANRSAVLGALLRHRAPVIVLAGHLHLRASAAHGTVLQLSHPALIELPHQLTMLEIDVSTGGPTVSRQAHRLPDGGPVPAGGAALTAPNERWQFDGGTWRREK